MQMQLVDMQGPSNTLSAALLTKKLGFQLQASMRRRFSLKNPYNIPHARPSLNWVSCTSLCHLSIRSPFSKRQDDEGPEVVMVIFKNPKIL
ncbi:hypothetical protein GOP47_0014371 [Adiantum capillus-veneris]|nr:hypothetical protein GOP47_0014371 [Adiantum capillus-veneris]